MAPGDDDVHLRRCVWVECEHQPAGVGGRQFLSHSHTRSHRDAQIKVRPGLPLAVLSLRTFPPTADSHSASIISNTKETYVAKAQQRGNREAKKPKKEK